MLSLIAALAVAVQDPPTPLAIVDVTVVDVRAGELLPGRTVVVRGDRIETVAEANGFAVPDDAQRVDGAGRYLVPGLWDMHVHMTQARRFGDLYIANGVTGVRDMFTTGNISRLKDRFLSWKSVGPRVVAAGRIVDGEDPVWPYSYEAKDADEGREAVRSLVKAGADFVKVYSKLSREAYFAIADEAGQVGLPFCGHVPFSVSAVEASEAGQRSIEHLTGVLSGCSSREGELVGATMDEVSFDDRGRIARESYDPEKARRLFAVLAENETWQCPTLVVLRSISHLDDPEFVADERLQYIPESWREVWAPENDFRFQSNTEDDWAEAREGYRFALELVGAMHAAGVPILAGTDCGNPYTFPGFSLHDELELLVSVGLTPAEALRTATWNPAVYLGLEEDLGSIQSGKLADLLLLKSNPLEDVRNTTAIEAVIARGRLFDRVALDALIHGG